MRIYRRVQPINCFIHNPRGIRYIEHQCHRRKIYASHSSNTKSTEKSSSTNRLFELTSTCISNRLLIGGAANQHPTKDQLIYNFYNPINIFAANQSIDWRTAHIHTRTHTRILSIGRFNDIVVSIYAANVTARIEDRKIISKSLNELQH